MAGISEIVAPLRWKVLTVASSPGMPAMTISPLTAVVLRTGDDEVAVHDADVDHRIATNPQHEQIAGAGEVFRQREQLLDVLLRQHVGTGGDIADQRDVTNRAALDGDTRRRVEADLDGARLGWVTLEEAHSLQ